MCRHTSSHSAEFFSNDINTFKSQVLNWGKSFQVLTILDNNAYAGQGKPAFDFLLGAGVDEELIHHSSLEGTASGFHKLQTFHDENPSWLLGFLSYDLKNELEKLNSSHPNNFDFPDLYFFKPTILIRIIGPKIFIESNNQLPAYIFQEITNSAGHVSSVIQNKPTFHTKFSKQDYLDVLKQIKKDIRNGDYYEINFCQEFFATCKINPFDLFFSLNQFSPAPFASFFKLGSQYLIGASPERFLKKSGNQLISQPIKGTMKRGKNAAEDAQLAQKLATSAKDRAENVMIVDLVRNDLAKCCIPGTVKVDELFGIYTFPQVFQMISTITGQLRPDLHFTDALAATFPMGSMTGAPKIMSMQRIEELEKSRRGLFSGAIGYITPDGDFDFNVVIRSLIYNDDSHYLSYQTGGAIVYDSNPEEEYEECLLKGSAIRRLFES